MAARILIVEDEESLTTLLRYNLDAAGYAVETSALIDKAAALSPDKGVDHTMRTYAATQERRLGLDDDHHLEVMHAQ